MNGKGKILTSMAIFGTIGLFVRLIPLPSSMIALVRAAMGALFLLGMILFQKRKPDWAGIRRNWKPLLLSSIAMATEWILLFESYRYTTVAVATLCYYVSAVFVIIAAPFILKEKITAHKAVCAAAAGDLYMVVDQQRHAVTMAEPGHLGGFAQERFFIQLLFAKLHQRRAADERLFDLL